MPPPAPRRFRLALAVVGYLLSAASCMVGMTVVLMVWGTWVVFTAAYLLWTGRPREVAARRWW